jgi:uncharacterized membrane protein
MQLIAILMLSVMIAASVMPLSSGVLIGSAFAVLISWCVNLQKRIAALEASNSKQRAARLATAVSPVPVPAPAVTAPATPRTPTPKAAADTQPRIYFTDRRTAEGSFDRTAESPQVRDSQAPRRSFREENSGSSGTGIDRLIARSKAWLTSGNVPVKAGVILSLFGLAFLAKEAIDRSWLVLPIEFRLLGIAAFGIALLVIGWRLRETRAGYGLALQGGGVAITYLSIYAAYGLYSLIPAVPAFALLVATTCLAGWLAVSQNTRALAVLGIIGGFMAPVLASNGAGEHVVLFSYYAILNAAILVIAWLRAWRELNVLGFVFTFVIGSLWGYTAYRPGEFATTEPFLVLFFLFYVFIPICFARNAPPRLRGFVDGTLVFGTPLIAFTLQMALVGDTRFGLACSAAVLALFYAGLASALLLRAPPYTRVLGEAFCGLAAVFLTITIPLYFDAQATSLVWAVEGAAMCWLGWRQDRRLPLASGTVLQLLAALAWIVSNPFDYSLPAVLNGPLLGAIAIAIAAAFSSRIFDLSNERNESRFSKSAAAGLFVWAALWWFGAGFYEIERVVEWGFDFKVRLAFAAGSVALAALIARIAAWPRPNVLGLVLFPALLFGLATSITEYEHPFAEYGWVAWTVVLACHLFYLRSAEAESPMLAKALHSTGFTVFTLLCAAEIYQHVSDYLPGVWPESTLVLFAGIVIVVVALFGHRVTWPLRANATAYKFYGAGTLAAIAALGTLMLNLVSDGSAGSLTYIPLVNPLELASIGFAGCLFVYLQEIRQLEEVSGIIDRTLQLVRPAAAVLSWLLLTMICARSVHHYAGVPFDFDALMASEVFHAALSILWGALAFGSMIAGTRQANRFIWLAGGVLMSGVVVKLFLIDLANTGTVERVISFLGVGILLLVVGYFAPVPPRAAPAAKLQHLA